MAKYKANYLLLVALAAMTSNSWGAYHKFVDIDDVKIRSYKKKAGWRSTHTIQK